MLSYFSACSDVPQKLSNQQTHKIFSVSCAGAVVKIRPNYYYWEFVSQVFEWVSIDVYYKQFVFRRQVLSLDQSEHCISCFSCVKNQWPCVLNEILNRSQHNRTGQILKDRVWGINSSQWEKWREIQFSLQVSWLGSIFVFVSVQEH